MERHVALQHAARRSHGDVAGRGAGWNRRLDVRVRNDGKVRRDSVKHNAGGSGEALTEDAAGLADLAECADKSYKRAKTHGEAEDRAAARVRIAGIVNPAIPRYPVEVSVGALNQAGRGDGTFIREPDKVVQRRQRACGVNLENCTIADATAIGCPVKITVRTLDQPSLRKRGCKSKGVQRCQLVRAWREFVDRAAAVAVEAALLGCTVELPVSGQ
jgi:hypothetical protein